MQLGSSFELHSKKAIPSGENCELFFWYPSVRGTVALFPKRWSLLRKWQYPHCNHLFSYFFPFLWKRHTWYPDSCIKFLIFYMTIIFVSKSSPSFVVSKHFYWCNSIKTHYNKLFQGNKPNTKLRYSTSWTLENFL